jgi:hypothetical protein
MAARGRPLPAVGRAGMVAAMLRGGVVGVLLVVSACKAPPNEPSMSADPSTPAPVPASAPNAEPAPAAASDPGPEPVIPPGSADYSAALADARAYRTGRIDFAELQRRVVARDLPPHGLGDGYLMMPVPAPPPGVPFDPMIMPGDWKGTFGEVAMTHFAGQITREEYDRLHRAAHPMCKP